jgi:hypothetical protein
LVKENRKGDRPCRNWGAAYVQTNERKSCWDRLNQNRRALDYFSDLPQSTHVCGKCAALMPCCFRNPVFDLETSDRRKLN